MAAKQQKDRRFVGAIEGGRYTGHSPWTLRRKAYSGELTSFKCGTRLLFDLDDLDKWIESGKRPALAESQKQNDSAA